MGSHLLDTTFGVCLIGVIIAAEFHGVACVQAWYYFTHQTDRWPLKLYVATLLSLDSVHQALITHTVYTYFVTNFDNPSQLNHIVWSLRVQVLINGLTALLAQSFLAFRVWRLSKGNKWLTGAALVLILAEFGSVLAYIARSIPLKALAEVETRLKALSITVNALAASSDVFIAAILCFLLLSSRTGFNRTDTMIRKLVLFFVNTGLFTRLFSLFAIASLISITVASTTFIYILFFFCMGRLYCNSLLAILNARKMIRGRDDEMFTTKDMPLSWQRAVHGQPRTESAVSARAENGKDRRELAVGIDTDTDRESAGDEDEDAKAGSR
ncbi:hypothetical protein B0H17DRAFT_1191242 [Mycena rosella]|uniref:DUF6534 domain-containing protein n=1 Tax=Mycena rosella TaxID=1033263 RepID=A0AAD7GZW2_MYCRO|nr:hypothetical protein B0H17DRAFT_1191242 [Mycena rosella]